MMDRKPMSISIVMAKTNRHCVNVDRISRIKVFKLSGNGSSGIHSFWIFAHYFIFDFVGEYIGIMEKQVLETH